MSVALSTISRPTPPRTVSSDRLESALRDMQPSLTGETFLECRCVWLSWPYRRRTTMKFDRMSWRQLDVIAGREGYADRDALISDLYRRTANATTDHSLTGMVRLFLLAYASRARK